VTGGRRSSSESGRIFLAATRRHLLSEYPAKIDAALALLGPDDPWWRPNPRTNSIGQLLRHLSGNVRQWIVHGVGGEPDRRERVLEFEAPPEPIGDVRARLGSTLADAHRVLAALSPDELTRPRTIQGLETTVQEALYHVVEHFAMHTGQILWIAKARTGRDLGFYEVDDDGNVIATHW
jgi:uncharacterized damage-inducible protein DinB